MIRRLMLSVLLSACLAVSAAAQTTVDYRDFNCPEVGGLELQETIFDLETVGDFVYAGLGDSTIAVLDFSEPIDPGLVAVYPTIGGVRDLACGDGMLWSIGRSGDLQGFEIGLDGSLSPVGHLAGLGEAWRIELNGTAAYVGVNDGGLTVVDLSVAAAPVVADQGDTELDWPVLECDGSTLWVESYSDVTVLDVSDPLVPVEVHAFTAETNCSSLLVEGERLYCSGAFGLYAYGVADPQQPELLGGVGMGLEFKPDIVALGDRVYVGGGGLGLAGADFSDPGAPELFVTADIPIYGYALCSVGQRLILGDAYGRIHVFEPIPVAPNPRLAHLEFTETQEVRLVSQAGDRVAVADYDKNVHFFDVSDPAAPVALSTVTLPYQGDEILLSDGRAIVRDRSGYEYIYDLSNPAAPNLVYEDWIGDGDHPEYWNELVVSYLSSQRRISIRYYGDLSAPFDVGISEQIPDGPPWFEIIGDIVWISTWSDGLYGIDISVPASPTIVAHLADMPVLYGIVEVADGVLCGSHYGTDAAGLQMVDISDPTAPAVLGEYEIKDLHAQHVALHDGILYAGEYCGGFVAVDVRDPLDPSLLGSFMTEGFCCDVMIVGSGESACLATLSLPYSVEFFPLQTAPFVSGASASARVGGPLRAAPNPFNPACVLSFELPAAGPVTIGIYDVKGRKVADLMSSRSLAAGAQQATWNGRTAAGGEAPSGVYFALLESPSLQDVEKLVLVR